MTRSVWLPVIGAFVVFVLAWKAIVVVTGLPPFILPAPETVGQSFVEAWLDGTFWPHFLTTMVEIAIGFIVGTVLALIAGYGLARSDLFARLASPYLVAAQAVPILVLAPLLVVWFGSGLLSKAVICSLIVFFPVAIATMVGIRSVDPRLLELGRSLRATKRQILTTLEIPAALPNIFGGLRVGVTLAVVGAVVGEWAGASTRPGRPDQPRPGVALRHPVDVRHAPDHRPGRDRPLSRRRRRRAQARRRAVNQPAQTEVHVSSALPRRPMRFAAVAAFAVVVAIVSGCTSGTAEGTAVPPSNPPAASLAPGESPEASITPTKLVVGLGYIPSVQFAPVLPRPAERLLRRCRPGRRVPEQDRPRPHHAGRPGRHRRRDRRRDQRHPGRQPGHPGRLHRHDLRQVPQRRLRQGLVRDQDGGRPEGQEDRDPGSLRLGLDHAPGAPRVGEPEGR